jgi:hypothetical protein
MGLHESKPKRFMTFVITGSFSLSISVMGNLKDFQENFAILGFAMFNAD